jgi:phospholipid/cholesterol/gamma-HCH transport system permease protein
MSESQEMAVILDSQAAAKKGSGGFAATTGQWTIHQVRGLIQLISIAVAVIWQGLQPLTWRRTVRAEFFQQCYLVGLRALPFILITGSLVGLGMVYQAIYWLGVFGQTKFTGPILVLVLVREVAPLFVALTVIGRSGSVILVELGNMQIDGQVRMLDAQGIDPFLFLIVPRVAAVAVSMFSLTIAFIMFALVSGFLAGNALGSLDVTLQEFVFRILSEMGLAEFATIPLKSFFIGFVVALIACTTGLSVNRSRSDLLAALSRGVTKSVLAALLISGLLTLLL